AFAREEIAQTMFCRIFLHSLGRPLALATGSISGQLVYFREPPPTRTKCPREIAVLPAICPKNVIPQRRTDAVTRVIVVKMVTQVVLFQPIPNAALHRIMMDRVMD